jgi:hypothetical protein
MVEDVCTSPVSRTSGSSSESRFTSLSAKTLAHLHRQPRSTSYCSRPVALFPEKCACILRLQRRAASSFKDASHIANESASHFPDQQAARLHPARAASENVVCCCAHVKHDVTCVRKIFQKKSARAQVTSPKAARLRYRQRAAGPLDAARRGFKRAARISFDSSRLKFHDATVVGSQQRTRTRRHGVMEARRKTSFVKKPKKLRVSVSPCPVRGCGSS